MTDLPLILYIFLFSVTIFAPLRWSLIAFLLLSNIDLGSLSSAIGLLNTAKAVVLPIYLLWRFRAFAGHTPLTAAPLAWTLLILYAAVASAWSAFPMFAIKLVGHMIGSLVICLMLIRASKSGYVTPQLALPVGIGAIIIAVFHWFLLHSWGGETERFTTFAGAQAFAAFAAALYSLALCSKSIRPEIRIALCSALAMSVLLNGSRLWIAGLCLMTLLSVFVSEIKLWIKVTTLGLTFISGAVAVAEFDSLMGAISQHSQTNRIAAAATAVYQGNTKAHGLGTYNLRYELFRRTLQGVKSGSLWQLLFGHGTCNGALIAATLSRNPDPNRAMHNEWLRTLYEWGITGLILWLIFIGSLTVYAIGGARRDSSGYSLPLLIYMPAFALGLAGENFIAAAGNASSVGFLLLIALASVSHRPKRRLSFTAIQQPLHSVQTA